MNGRPVQIRPVTLLFRTLALIRQLLDVIIKAISLTLRDTHCLVQCGICDLVQFLVRGLCEWYSDWNGSKQNISITFRFCQWDQTSHYQFPNKCNIDEIKSELIKNWPNSYNGYGTCEAIASTRQHYDIMIVESFIHFPYVGSNKVKAAELFTFAGC